MPITRARHTVLRLAALALAVLFALSTPSTHARQGGQPSGDDLVRVRLVAERSHLVPGQDADNHIALVYRVSRGWHIYWRNPGVTGMRPTWEFDVPEGVTVGEPQWPVPQMYATTFDQGASYTVDYIYEGSVLILFPVTIDESLANQDELTIEVSSDWLVCKDICLPGSGKASLSLPVAQSPGDAQPTRTARLFERTRRSVPTEAETPEEAGLKATWDGGTLVISAPGADELIFFPHETGQETPAYPLNTKADTKKKADTLRIRYDKNQLAAIDEIVAVVSVKRGSDVSHHQITIDVPAE
jgi:DsbC/DsbD-like thiol-disulfide interchange protein